MGIQHIASQWRRAAWQDEAPPSIGYHATSYGAAKSIERGGFSSPGGTYFASSADDALRFVALRIQVGQYPEGVVGVVVFDASGLDVQPGWDHSPAFFGEDTTSWTTTDAIGPERIFGVEMYEVDGAVTASRTAAKRMPAKFPGKCVDCSKRIERGETIYYDGKVHCEDCGKGSATPRRQRTITCPFHGVVPEDDPRGDYHHDCFTDWRLTHGSRSGSFRQAAHDTSKVYYGLVKPHIPKGAGQQAIMAYGKPNEDNDNMFPLGAVLFDDQHLVSIYVSDAQRGRGMAKGLLDAMDQHVGRQLPDDGYRTRPGAGLLNHLGRPKGKFVKWVSEFDAMKPVSNLVGFDMLWVPESAVIAKVFNP